MDLAVASTQRSASTMIVSGPLASGAYLLGVRTPLPALLTVLGSNAYGLGETGHSERQMSKTIANLYSLRYIGTETRAQRMTDLAGPVNHFCFFWSRRADEFEIWRGRDVFASGPRDTTQTAVTAIGRTWLGAVLKPRC